MPRFSEAFARLEIAAPEELNKAMAEIARKRILPGARTRAGSGIASSLSVVPGPKLRGPAVKSGLPYAWAHHGAPSDTAGQSQSWNAVSRVGKGPRSIAVQRLWREHPGKEPGYRKRLFVTGTIEDNDSAITHDIGEAVDRLMREFLP